MTRKKRCKVAVFGWYAHDNLGDDLLLKATLRILGAIDPEITLYGDERRIRLLLDEYGCKFEDILVKPRTPKNIIQDAFSHDAFFYSGGGLFPTKNYSKAIFYVLISVIYRVRGRQVFFEGLSIEDFNCTNPAMRKIVSLLIYLATHFSTRDSLIQGSGFSAGVKKKIDYMPDLVFSLPSGLASTPQDEVILVCCANIFDHSSKETMASFVNDIAYVIDDVAGKQSVVKLLSFSRSDEALNESILNAVMELETEIQVELLSFEDTSSRCDDLFNSASLSICMRFHSLVLSVRAQCPMFSISYSNKNAGLMLDMGLVGQQVFYGTGASEYLNASIGLDRQELIDGIRNLELNRNDVKSRVSNAYQEMRHYSEMAVSRVLLVLESK